MSGNSSIVCRASSASHKLMDISLLHAKVLSCSATLAHTETNQPFIATETNAFVLAVCCTVPPAVVSLPCVSACPVSACTSSQLLRRCTVSTRSRWLQPAEWCLSCRQMRLKTRTWLRSITWKVRVVGQIQLKKFTWFRQCHNFDQLPPPATKKTNKLYCFVTPVVLTTESW